MKTDAADLLEMPISPRPAGRASRPEVEELAPGDFATLLARQRQRRMPARADTPPAPRQDRPQRPEPAQQADESRTDAVELSVDIHGQAAAGQSNPASGDAETSDEQGTAPPPGRIANQGQAGNGPPQDAAAGAKPTAALLEFDRLPFQEELRISHVAIRSPAAQLAANGQAVGAGARIVDSLTTQVAQAIMDQVQLTQDSAPAPQPASPGPASPAPPMVPHAPSSAPPSERPALPATPTSIPVAGQDRQEAVEQVARASQRPMNAQQATAHIRLDPPDLGVLRVQLEVRGETLTAHLHPATPQAQEALSNRLGDLRNTLEQAGIQVDRLEVSYRSPVHQPDASRDDMQEQTPHRQGGGQTGRHEQGSAWRPTAADADGPAPEPREAETPRPDVGWIA